MTGQTDGLPDQAALRGQFEELAPRIIPRLRALAWKFGLPPDEWDDAVQDVLTKAWNGLDRFRGDAKLETWLIRIAVHAYTSRKRAVARRLWRMVRRQGELDLEDSPIALTPEKNEAYRHAHACIRALPPKLRAVFVLRYLEELPCAAVAAMLGIPEATVRTRIFHARKKLRAMMKEFDP